MDSMGINFPVGEAETSRRLPRGRINDLLLWRQVLNAADRFPL